MPCPAVQVATHGGTALARGCPHCGTQDTALPWAMPPGTRRQGEAAGCRGQPEPSAGQQLALLPHHSSTAGCSWASAPLCQVPG